MRHICVILTALLLASAATAHAAATDSLDRAVAVFFASQFKIAFANGLADLRATGLDVDSAEVVRLMTHEITLPYDTAAQDRAFATIDAAANAVVLNESKHMLALAAEAPGAVVLPSGVVIRTVKEGNGDTLKASDTVTLRYTGRLPDGTVFDSMTDEDEPIVSPANQFVPGMTEALTHMRPGGSYTVTIPADMAYGSHGVQGVIPPNCTLQFDITLY